MNRRAGLARGTLAAMLLAGTIAASATEAEARQLASLVAEAGFVHGPHSADLERAVEGMAEAASAYERFFGVPAPRVALILYDETGRLEMYPRDRYEDCGYVYQRWPARGSFIGGMSDPRPWPVETFAHEVMHALVVARLGRDRIPPWYSEGIAVLAEPEGGRERHWSRLAQAEDRFPLADLFTLPHPADRLREEYAASQASGELGDTVMHFVTTHPSPEQLLFYPMSMAFLSWVTELEGASFVGRLGDGLAQGHSVAELVAEARSLPPGIDALGEAFERWLIAR